METQSQNGDIPLRFHTKTEDRNGAFLLFIHKGGLTHLNSATIKKKSRSCTAKESMQREKDDFTSEFLKNSQ